MNLSRVLQKLHKELPKSLALVPCRTSWRRTTFQARVEDSLQHYTPQAPHNDKMSQGATDWVHAIERK